MHVHVHADHAHPEHANGPILSDRDNNRDISTLTTTNDDRDNNNNNNNNNNSNSNSNYINRVILNRPLRISNVAVLVMTARMISGGPGRAGGLLGLLAGGGRFATRWALPHVYL